MQKHNAAVKVAQAQTAFAAAVKKLGWNGAEAIIKVGEMPGTLTAQLVKIPLQSSPGFRWVAEDSLEKEVNCFLKPHGMTLKVWGIVADSSFTFENRLFAMGPSTISFDA